MDIRQKIVDLRVNDKLTLRAIGQRVGLTHERVRQILTEEGVPTARPIQPKSSQTAKVQYNHNPERIQRIYGCTLNEVRKIQNGLTLSAPHSPARLYNLHRKRFLAHPGWEMSFVQWWAIWRRVWKHRVKKNLVLMPLDPDKPMSPDNAQIMTRRELMELHWQHRQG